MQRWHLPRNTGLVALAAALAFVVPGRLPGRPAEAVVGDATRPYVLSSPIFTP